MKTKKMIVTFALLLIYSTTHAQLSTVSSTATTPDDFIRQCPALPTVKQLVDLENSINIRASRPEIGAYEAQVEMLRDNAKRILESAEKTANEAGEKDADRVAKQFTGHTQAEMDKMSEAESETMVNNMLASMGMNITLDQIEDLEDKSDAEILAALSKGGAATGSKSKAIEGVNTQDVAVIMQTNTELRNFNASWREFFLQIEKEEKEAERQIAAIDAKYAPRVFAIKPSIPLSGEMGGWDFTEAERKARENLIVSCRTEQFTLWRNHTIKVQDRIKAKMANDVPRYDKLMKQYLTATGMTSSAQLTPSAGYSFAIEYLYAARSVTSLPGIDIFGVLGEKN